MKRKKEKQRPEICSEGSTGRWNLARPPAELFKPPFLPLSFYLYLSPSPVWSRRFPLVSSDDRHSPWCGLQPGPCSALWTWCWVISWNNLLDPGTWLPWQKLQVVLKWNVLRVIFEAPPTAPTVSDGGRRRFACFSWSTSFRTRCTFPELKQWTLVTETLMMPSLEMWWWCSPAGGVARVLVSFVSSPILMKGDYNQCVICVSDVCIFYSSITAVVGEPHR